MQKPVKETCRTQTQTHVHTHIILRYWATFVSSWSAGQDLFSSTCLSWLRYKQPFSFNLSAAQQANTVSAKGKTHTQHTHTHFYWHSKSLQSDPNQWCPTMPLLEPLVRPWIKLCPYFSNFSLMLCMCRPGRKLHNWSRPNLFCRENLPSGQPHTLARTRTKSERPEHVAGTNLQIAHHGSSFLRAVGESTRALYRFNCANAVLTQGPFQVQPVCALLVFNDMMGW